MNGKRLTRATVVALALAAAALATANEPGVEMSAKGYAATESVSHGGLIPADPDPVHGLLSPRTGV